MKLLDFKRLTRKESLALRSAPGGIVAFSSELPGVEGAARRNPGASGGDHTTPEQDLTSAPGEPASMRRILSLRCANGHEWTAPGLGACPTCHVKQVEALTEKTCVLPRV